MSEKKIKPLKTTKDLAISIINGVKETGNWPDILDYANTYDDSAEIYDSEFDVIGDLRYGANEGIYLVLYAEGFFGKDRKLNCKVELATFKTLYTGNDAMYTMARLQASCIIAWQQHMAKHAEEYIRHGYKVTITNPWHKSYSLYCPTEERARARKPEDGGSVKIVDLYTGEELEP